MYQEVTFMHMTLKQKLHIMCSMQACSGVVGITGDGVNNVPALHAEDMVLLRVFSLAGA